MHRRQRAHGWRWDTDVEWLGKKLGITFEEVELPEGIGALVVGKQVSIARNEDKYEKTWLRCAATAAVVLGRSALLIASSAAPPDALVGALADELVIPEDAVRYWGPRKRLYKGPRKRAADVGRYFDTHAAVVWRRYYATPELFGLSPEEFFEADWISQLYPSAGPELERPMKFFGARSPE